MWELGRRDAHEEEEEFITDGSLVLLLGSFMYGTRSLFPVCTNVF